MAEAALRYTPKGINYNREGVGGGGLAVPAGLHLARLKFGTVLDAQTATSQHDLRIFKCSAHMEQILTKPVQDSPKPPIVAMNIIFVSS